MGLKQQIITTCDANNARAYITINNRSDKETDSYIQVYRRQFRPTDARYIYAVLDERGLRGINVKYLEGKDEEGHDHPDAVFKLFQGEIDGFSVLIKLKCNRDGNILWALKLNEKAP